MREVTPKELQKLNSKSFKNTQKIFRRRLREIAAGGENKAKYKPDDYCCGDHIADWLKSLGFTVKQVNPIWCEITWPEGEDILEKLRKETAEMLTQPIKFTWGVKIKREELGTWKFDPFPYDYICSACDKHSEYKTRFCPNCGAKMHIEEDKNGS